MSSSAAAVVSATERAAFALDAFLEYRWPALSVAAIFDELAAAENADLSLFVHWRRAIDIDELRRLLPNLGRAGKAFVEAVLVDSMRRVVETGQLLPAFKTRSQHASDALFALCLSHRFRLEALKRISYVCPIRRWLSKDTTLLLALDYDTSDVLAFVLAVDEPNSMWRSEDWSRLYELYALAAREALDQQRTHHYAVIIDAARRQFVDLGTRPINYTTNSRQFASDERELREHLRRMGAVDVAAYFTQEDVRFVATSLGVTNDAATRLLDEEHGCVVNAVSRRVS
jgi:hypothetical protein